jgi:hypothetical protein
MRRSVLVTSTALVLVAPALSAAAAAPPPEATVPVLPPQARVDTPEAHAHEDRVQHDSAKEATLMRHTKDTIQSDVQAALAATVAPPQQIGQWGPLTEWPVVGVHTALLPNGKVLSFDSVGDTATENYAVHDHTRATVWDPVSGTHTPVDVRTGYNVFCAGLAHLPNGEVFLAGGNKDAQLGGIAQTHVFDPWSNTWSLGNDMAYERWYPTVTPLPNGESLITGGRPNLPEIRSTSGAMRTLTGASQGSRCTPGWTSHRTAGVLLRARRPDALAEHFGHRRLAVLGQGRRRPRLRQSCRLRHRQDPRGGRWFLSQGRQRHQHQRCHSS